MKLTDLAQHIGATLHTTQTNDQSRDITGVNTIDKAKPSELTFLTNPRFRDQLRHSQAAAVIIAEYNPELNLSQLVHKNPYAAMAKAASLFHSYRHSFRGQSELAFVHPEANVHPDATIYPFAYIDRGAHIAAGVIIYPQCYIGIGASVGAESVLFPGVTLMNDCHVGANNILHPGAVLGGDGFGFAPSRDGMEKIPQIAGVRLAEDIEVGSNTTIDRGAFEDTSLARGCKLDSHVHIGHGAQVGEHSMICGLSGLGGSAKIGKRFIAAGHCGVAPGLEIADNVILGAMTGVTSGKDTAGEYLGMPAVPSGEWRRQMVALNRLPELLKTVRSLTARLEKLENKQD